jgi:glycosyltransferase involved in cell wall biosynthesis
MSDVDVIVPCYCYGHFLRQCVESVLSQDIRATRVLIIDDASPDATAEIASELASEDDRVAVRRHAKNLGHIATYNEGLDWASAKYVLLLSADDFLLPGALSRAVQLLDAHPEVGFAFGRCIELHPEDVLSGITLDDQTAETRVLTGAEFVQWSGAKNIVPTPTAVVRTDLQKRLGGYLPNLPHAGDMEMWLRFASRSSVGFINADQAVYRRHQQNMSLSFQGALAGLQQRKAVFDHFFETGIGRLPNAPLLRRAITRKLAADALRNSGTAFRRGDIVTSDRMAEFATGLCPEIRHSWAWGRLLIERRLDPRLLSAIYPLARALRARWPGSAMPAQRRLQRSSASGTTIRRQ